MWHKALFMIIAALLLALPAQGQALTVTNSEPRDVSNAAASTLSVTGSGFTSSTTVRLVGFGYLTPTLINDTALTAAVPAGVPAGIYSIEVTDPAGGTAVSPVRLIVTQPTTPIPIPSETPAPSAPVGQPSLIVRGFSASPSVVTAGYPFTVNFEVVNVGNLPAFGVSVAVDSGGKFLPANGSASITLPDIFPGGVYQASLSLTSANDTPEGVNLIPLTFSYRDSEGKALSSKASLSAVIAANASAPQVALRTYSVTPETVVPGELAVISAQISNMGTQTARQVMLRFTGDTRVLIAGPRGDVFPVGDIPAGESRIIELPMYVSQEAKAGIQPQAFTISYMTGDKTNDVPTTISVVVASVEKPLPLLLLETASIGVDEIRPGDRFTLNLTLANLGTADAANAVVVYGTVESSGNPNPPDNSGSGSGSGGTRTQPSANFAPVGTGGAQFLGVLAKGSRVDLTQEFIASGSLESGIYNLPVTVQYTRPDNTTATDSFSAAVVVVALPRLQVAYDTPLPPSSFLFEPVPLALTITNRAKNPLLIERIEVTAEGADVLDGATQPGGQIKTDEQTNINALIAPNTPGAYRVVVKLHYKDDLNRPQVYEIPVEGLAEEPPPPPELPEEPVVIETPEPTPPQQQDDLISKLLLGFLGLGE
jgi:hypothetical protein